MKTFKVTTRARTLNALLNRRARICCTNPTRKRGTRESLAYASGWYSSRFAHAYIEEARDDDVRIETEDGERFVLSAVDDFAHEIEAQRRNKKLMAYLDECAKATEWIPLEEVERTLGLNRKKTSKPRRPRKKVQK